ncbi:MAG TPA: hypothetical protein VMD53_18960 [Rhizomicrobium sp.]|nr:hypothetical protein [Rhizomicrobium sp.]
MLSQEDCVAMCGQIIVADIANAFESNHIAHATELFATLREFLNRHPDAADDLIGY